MHYSQAAHKLLYISLRGPMPRCSNGQADRHFREKHPA